MNKRIKLVYTLASAREKITQSNTVFITVDAAIAALCTPSSEHLELFLARGNRSRLRAVPASLPWSMNISKGVVGYRYEGKLTWKKFPYVSLLRKLQQQIIQITEETLQGRPTINQSANILARRVAVLERRLIGGGIHPNEEVLGN